MGQDTLFSTKKTLRVRHNVRSLSPAIVMGILNITPDSFSDGGELTDMDSVILRAGDMLAEGASILDVGGYSTRPGADDISVNEEMERVIPVIENLRNTFPEAIISIDTFRSAVAAEAINVGADMVNDISGGTLDDDMFKTVAALNVPYVLMHMRGTPQNMNSKTEYTCILSEILTYFNERITELNALGVHEILLDPGLGFAKNRGQNYYLLKSLNYFKSLGLPLLVGISRKSMIFKELEISPKEALNGTSVLNTFALLQGASILRVHDVKEAIQCVKLVTTLNNSGNT